VNRTSGLAALLLLAVAAPVAAQDAPRHTTWTLKELRSGVCVDFLVAPAAAQGEVAGRIPTPIESVAAQYPVLARVAAAESTYRGWIPAEYCWFLYESVVIGGKTYDVQDGRQPVMVGYLDIAAGPLPDSAGAVAVGFFTNSTAVERSMVQARLQVDLIHFEVLPVPGAEEDRTQARYEARHRGATVQWDGGPGSLRTPEPRAIRLVGFTPTMGLHGIRATITPDSTFASSGNFRVVGKGTLQAMLSASPIRLLTPYARGGDTEWELGRQ
jgi:hypothetical protein